MKINLVNKVQNDLLETRALVSLFSILFRQVGSQLVPGIFALGVRRGETPPRRGCLGWETVVPEFVPLPILFCLPRARDKCMCMCACVDHPKGERECYLCVQGFPQLSETGLSDSRNCSFLTRLAKSCFLKCWINWQVSVFFLTSASLQRFAPQQCPLHSSHQER